MDIDVLIEELRLADHVLAILLGTPRLFMIIQIAPFLGGAVITGTVRVAISISFYCILHPYVLGHILDHNLHIYSSKALSYGLIVLKEVLIGSILGLLIGMLFWAVQGTGIFIDNQRGATQSSEQDILSGDQTSPLGALFFQAMVMVMFASGIFLVLLKAIYSSYIYWPVTSYLPIGIFTHENFALFFAGQVSNLLLLIVIFSGPIIIACLIADLSLGLINRFASQLNVYILAMPIKSAIACFLAIFYLAMLLKFIQPRLYEIVNMLQGVASLL